MNFSKETYLAIKTAKKAGKLLKEGFYKKFKIFEKKGIHNLVTKYDLESEKLIIKEIKKYYPTHSFLTEEEGALGSSFNKWIVDPLDGTVNFAHGIPFFCVSIAFQKKEEIISGVTYQPMTNELFVVEKNIGAFLNGKKIKVSKTKDIKNGFFATGFPYNVFQNPKKCIDKFTKIVKKGLPLRRLGAAALDIAYVADGRFDGYWETNLAPWDCAVGMLLIKEANGKVTDWDNKPFKLKNKNSILVSNKKLHEKLSGILKNG